MDEEMDKKVRYILVDNFLKKKVAKSPETHSGIQIW